MNVNGAPKLDILLYPITFKANSINYEKLDYYHITDVVKFKDDNFKVPWKYINDKKRPVSIQRSAPTSTMTIMSLLNTYKGRNEYTTSIPIDEPTQIIKYPEPISELNSDKKNIRAADKTISEILWGSKDTISLPITEPTFPPAVTTSKSHRDGSIHELIHDDANNFVKIQDHGSIHPGYDYDDTICKIINKRILCGYNKNLGIIFDNEAFTDLKGNCRMRGNRIECGYLDGTLNLNNEVPYNQFLNKIYRNKPDEGQGVNTTQLRTNNLGNFDTLEKLNKKNGLRLYHIIRLSNLRDIEVDFQREYKKELSPRHYSLLHDYSRIQYLYKHHTPKRDKKSGKIKTTITMDLDLASKRKI